MNTLFEKFKEYALTKEQASQVRGGHDYCQILRNCLDNAYAAAYETDNGLSNPNDKERLYWNLHGACTNNFWGGCQQEMSDRWGWN